MANKKPNFTEKVVLAVPPSLAENMDLVAARKLMTRSEYIRRALLDALSKDGVVPLAA